MIKTLKKLTGQNTIKSATFILIVTLFLSNVMGLFRDHYLAQKIPTTILDAYYAAFRIPDLLFNVLIVGAITASFIPIFSKYIVNNNLKQGWKVANSFINIGIIIILIFLIILFFLMPWVINIMVPNFDLEKKELTVNLSRIILLSPIFFTLSYTFGAILNSFKKFFIYSLAPLIYNLSIIIATIFFADKYGIYAVAIGVVLGAFLHMLIQLIQLLYSGYKYKFNFDYKNKDVKKIFYLMIPRSIGLGAAQIMLIAYTAIASHLKSGSVAIFNLTDNIQTMPTVVFGISFATAIFPTLSEHINLRKLPEFSYHIHKIIKSVIYILAPITMLIIMLRAQIIRLILGSGYFGWEETIIAYNTLAMFAISLVFQGLIPLLARAFYAMRNTKTPTIISIISVALGIVLAYFLAPFLGVKGLALAFSISSTFNAITLYFILRKKIIDIKNNEKGIIQYLIKVIFATLFAGVFIQISKNCFGSMFDMNRFWGVALQTLFATIIGFAIYLLFSKIFKLSEFQEVKNTIYKYFFKKYINEIKK